MKIDVTGKHFFGVLQVLSRDKYKQWFNVVELTEALMFLKFLDIELVNLSKLTEQIRETVPDFTDWYLPEIEEYLEMLKRTDCKLGSKINRSFTGEFYTNMKNVKHYLKGFAEDITEIKLETVFNAMSLEPELNLDVLCAYMQRYPIWQCEIRDHYDELQNR